MLAYNIYNKLRTVNAGTHDTEWLTRTSFTLNKNRTTVAGNYIY